LWRRIPGPTTAHARGPALPQKPPHAVAHQRSNMKEKI
jgi:hypothetical protein